MTTPYDFIEFSRKRSLPFNFYGEPESITHNL